MASEISDTEQADELRQNFREAHEDRANLLNAVEELREASAGIGLNSGRMDYSTALNKLFDLAAKIRSTEGVV